MDLILLVLVLALVGFFVWFITTKIPMDANFKVVIYVVVAVFLILWLLHKFGEKLPNFL